MRFCDKYLKQINVNEQFKQTSHVYTFRIVYTIFKYFRIQTDCTTDTSTCLINQHDLCINEFTANECNEKTIICALVLPNTKKNSNINLVLIAWTLQPECNEQHFASCAGPKSVILNWINNKICKIIKLHSSHCPFLIKASASIESKVVFCLLFWFMVKIPK